MWNCRWILYLVVIGLAARRASSMNEQPRDKNDSPKSRDSDESLSMNTNSDGKRKSQDEPSVKDRDQAVHSSPAAAAAATATAGVATNLTNFNVTVALVAPDTVSATSINAANHEQSHSKRHFHRSKLYRKEARTKSRTSLIKSNGASGNLIPFSADHLVVPSHVSLHRPENSSDSMKLPESIPKTRAVTTSHDNSISTASSRSLFTNESPKDTSDGKFDKLSSRMTVSSGSTENWDNSSSSSEAGSIIDEKSSSVELMEFTFDSVGEIRQSTSPSEMMNRVGNSTSASVVMDHSPSTTIVTVHTPERPIVKSKSASADLPYREIDRGQSIQNAGSDADDDVIIYSVHTEISRDEERLPNELSTSMKRDNITNDDSMILVSIASESSASRNSRDTSSKRIGRSNNESNSTKLENNSNHSRSDVDGHSWVSVDDNSNRISLPEVVDALKNVQLQETHGSYSDSNSTLSQDTDTGAVSTKHSQSLTVSDADQSPRELRRSMLHSYALPVSALTKKIEHPLKAIIPLNIKARTKNNIVVEDVKLPRPSTSGELSSEKISSDQRVAGRKDSFFRLVLNLEPPASRCSSNSSTERLQNIRRINSENPFYQRPSSEITLSLSENSISEPEQCLTRRSSGQVPLRSTDEPQMRIETFVLPVIPSNSEEREGGLTLPANQTLETEAEAMNLLPPVIDEHRGAQSLVSSGFIILENFEPVVRESLASEESVVPFESDTTTAGHFFTAFADLEEYFNASSFNIFIPSINSRESLITSVKPEKEPSSSLVSREPQNLTTTEETLYIIEGFGFLKNSADEVSELEEEFDRRREVSFDYGETEIYPGYPQDDRPLAVKFIDQIEFETGLPIKQEPLVAARLPWTGNIGDRNDDLWWIGDEFKRIRDQTVKNDDTDDKTVFIPSEFGFGTWKDVPAAPSPVVKVLPNINVQSDIKSYRFSILSTARYVVIGICAVLTVCSIWCKRVSMKSNLKLRYFNQERERATHAVV